MCVAIPQGMVQGITVVSVDVSYRELVLVNTEQFGERRDTYEENRMLIERCSCDERETAPARPLQLILLRLAGTTYGGLARSGRVYIP